MIYKYIFERDQIMVKKFLFFLLILISCFILGCFSYSNSILLVKHKCSCPTCQASNKHATFGQRQQCPGADYRVISLEIHQKYNPENLKTFFNHLMFRHLPQKSNVFDSNSIFTICIIHNADNKIDILANRSFKERGKYYQESRYVKNVPPLTGTRTPFVEPIIR